MLLDGGLSPNAPMHDGRSGLFHTRLTPEAARVLLARGADRLVHDTRGGAADGSPVPYQADLRNWATALVLIEGGVPLDHGTPPGSVMARVIRIVLTGCWRSTHAPAGGAGKVLANATIALPTPSSVSAREQVAERAGVPLEAVALDLKIGAS